MPAGPRACTRRASGSGSTLDPHLLRRSVWDAAGGVAGDVAAPGRSASVPRRIAASVHLLRGRGRPALHGSALSAPYRPPSGSPAETGTPPVAPDLRGEHWAGNIRKFLLPVASLEELVQLSTLPGQAARLLEAAVVAGLNILVAGGTQAGNPTSRKDTQRATVTPAARAVRGWYGLLSQRAGRLARGGWVAGHVCTRHRLPEHQAERQSGSEPDHSLRRPKRHRKISAAAGIALGSGDRPPESRSG